MQRLPVTEQPGAAWKDGLIAAVIGIAAFWTFSLSPVSQVRNTDAQYALLLSHTLLTEGRFELTRHLPTSAKDDWRIEAPGGRLFYFFPPGTSILSVPFVALMNLTGRSVMRPDGGHDPLAELEMQVLLAAVLMALLVAIFYATARHVLPVGWSVVVAAGAAFGTHVWSNTSRALWSDTWGTLLIGIAIFLLVRAASGAKLHPFLLGTVLGLSYFVRPTYSVHIAAITVFVLIFHRRAAPALMAIGAVWLGLFVLYSWTHFHTLFPKYYRPSRLGFEGFSEALAGNLWSPSRGLVCYAPVVLFIAFLIIRYWKFVTWKGLGWITAFVVAAHLVVHSSPQGSLGGGCYGARLSSGLVPWFVLAAILGIDAARRAASKPGPLVWSAGALLLILSTVINGRGALAPETWAWNADFDLRPWKHWDWRHPQMLAGLIAPPQPEHVATLHGRVLADSADADPFFWFGWSSAEAGFRWNDGRRAGLIFATEARRAMRLTLRISPFLSPPSLTRQRVRIAFQSQPLMEITLDAAHSGIISIVLPAERIAARNIVTFHLPDAVAPNRFRLSDDPRQLAVQIFWIELQSDP